MCTKILKKESSSRALAFFMLMFMMPLGFIGNTQNCEAMQHDQAENSPLLGRVDTSINGNGSDVEQGRNNLTSVVVQSDDLLYKIDVPQDLLKELTSQNQKAVAAKKEVDQYLYYADLVSVGIDGEEGLEELFQESRVRLEISNSQELGKELLKRARAALKGNGDLLTYLKAIKSQASSLREKVIEFQKQEQSLQQQELARKREMAEKEKQICSLETSLWRTRWILGISLPAVTLLGIGAVLFTHYYWRVA